MENQMPGLSMASQLAALQRMAAFSAKVRGHELGEWQAGDGTASASCLRCGAGLRVYYSVLQPDMDGAALHCLCCEVASAQAA